MVPHNDDDFLAFGEKLVDVRDVIPYTQHNSPPIGGASLHATNLLKYIPKDTILSIGQDSVARGL